jgi:iron complex outermembrane receptor protein
VEVDFNWLLSEVFSLEGNMGLLDAEYDELVDPVTGTDLTYLKLRRAPDMTTTLVPVLTFDMAGGSLSARVSWNYVDDMELTFLNSPQSHVPAHSTIDASLTYSRNNFAVALWGLNLSEDDSWTQGYDVGTSLEFAGLWTYTGIRPPRTYGVNVTYRF